MSAAKKPAPGQAPVRLTSEHQDIGSILTIWLDSYRGDDGAMWPEGRAINLLARQIHVHLVGVRRKPDGKLDQDDVGWTIFDSHTIVKQSYLRREFTWYIAGIRDNTKRDSDLLWGNDYLTLDRMVTAGQLRC